MTIKFNVSGQIITRIDNNVPVADSRRYIDFEFEFSPEWDGVNKTAVISVGNSSPYYILVTDDKINAESLPVFTAGEWKVAVFGGDLITSNSAPVMFVPSGLKDGKTPAEPPEDIYGQILSLAMEAKETADSVRSDADSGLFDGKDGEASAEYIAIGEQVASDASQVALDKGIVGGYKNEVADAKTVILAKVAEAEGYKNNAQERAGVATEQANIAKIQADIATSKANTATEKLNQINAKAAEVAENTSEVVLKATQVAGNTATVVQKAAEVESDRAEVAANKLVIDNHAAVIEASKDIVVNKTADLNSKASIVSIKAAEVASNAAKVAADKAVVVSKAAEAAESAAAALESEQHAKTSEDNAKYHADEAERQAEIAANNILNGVATHNASEESHPHILGELVSIEAIARGRASSLTFDTEQQLIDWIAGDYERPDGKTVDDLNVGDNLYILDIDVPDYWWTGTDISELEAQAVNLGDYYTKTEVDARLPIVIEQSDYDGLVDSGQVIAGRIYYVVPDGALGDGDD